MGMSSLLKNEDAVLHLTFGLEIKKDTFEVDLSRLHDALLILKGKYPDDYDINLALSLISLLNGRVSLAYKILEGFSSMNERPEMLLRRSELLLLLDRQSEAEAIFNRLLENVFPDSYSQVVLALLVSGRLHNIEMVKTYWEMLLSGFSEDTVPTDETFLSSPNSHTLLSDASTREIIECIPYLVAGGYEQDACREMVGLIHTLENYVCDIFDEMMRTINPTSLSSLQKFASKYYETLCPDDSIPADEIGYIFALTSAYCKAIQAKVAEYADMFPSSLPPPLREDLIKRSERVGVIQKKSKIFSEFFDAAHLSGPVLPVLQEYLSLPYRNEDEILSVTSQVLKNLDDSTLDEVFDLLLSTFPADTAIQETRYNTYLMRERYSDAQSLADSGIDLSISPDEGDTLRIRNLNQQGLTEEAYLVGLACIREGRGFDHLSNVFNYAIQQDRISELIPLLPEIGELGATSWVHLLNGYTRIMKGDLKEGLNRMEQAKRAGIPEDMILLYSARFLLSAGYPKRVVGLCEKMKKRSMPADDLYPLLISAYRALGKDDEVKKAEERYAEITHDQ